MTEVQDYAAQKDELARIITSGLSQGVTAEDLDMAIRGDRSIGNYIADAILAMGFSKVTA